MSGPLIRGSPPVPSALAPRCAGPSWELLIQLIPGLAASKPWRAALGSWSLRPRRDAGFLTELFEWPVVLANHVRLVFTPKLYGAVLCFSIWSSRNST